MATSEIFYRGKSKYIKDTALGLFLNLLEQQIELASLNESDKNSWILNAYASWEGTWTGMPPGCKDIELDEFLINEEREKEFLKIAKMSIAAYESQTPEAISVIKEMKKIIDSV